MMERTWISAQNRTYKSQQSMRAWFNESWIYFKTRRSGMVESPLYYYIFIWCVCSSHGEISVGGQLQGSELCVVKVSLMSVLCAMPMRIREHERMLHIVSRRLCWWCLFWQKKGMEKRDFSLYTVYTFIQCTSLRARRMLLFPLFCLCFFFLLLQKWTYSTNWINTLSTHSRQADTDAGTIQCERVYTHYTDTM